LRRKQYEKDHLYVIQGTKYETKLPKEALSKKKIDLKKRCPTNEIFWFHALPVISEKPKKNC
jgi:hypothetical protein